MAPSVTDPRVRPWDRAVADSSTANPLFWAIQSPDEMGMMASVSAARVLATPVQKALPLFCWIWSQPAAWAVASAVASVTPMAVSRLERGADPVMVRHGLTVSLPMVVIVPE